MSVEKVQLHRPFEIFAFCSLTVITDAKQRPSYDRSQRNKDSIKDTLCIVVGVWESVKVQSHQFAVISEMEAE